MKRKRKREDGGGERGSRAGRRNEGGILLFLPCHSKSLMDKLRGERKFGGGKGMGGEFINLLSDAAPGDPGDGGPTRGERRRGGGGSVTERKGLRGPKVSRGVGETAVVPLGGPRPFH
ncbi:hypothetical protein EYF80_052111 [Liparis tanakae]|uniref:Uncharacterized protein n=1 Tax=Liparis tanakae TaxID=230148 RepID=A0A4Z2FA36_9TELE|nr:hypothetical protein EYF80_052111 [Liparis tanakae]